MEHPERICKSCHHPGTGRYCSHCGQALTIGRITFGNLLHEVAHFFTHLDKGMGYTLKELIRHPGRMQRSYIEGNRVNHQKPFAMYFVCATVLGLSLYWVNVVLIRYFHAGYSGEASFFHSYMVSFLLLAIPFSALVTYSFFWSSGFNFSEITVLQLYTIAMCFLIVVATNLIRLVWHSFETRYIELPAIVVYNIVTYLRFFKGSKWLTLVKGALAASIVFLTLAFLQDYLVEHFVH
jgi:hypothetical protein